MTYHMVWTRGPGRSPGRAKCYFLHLTDVGTLIWNSHYYFSKDKFQIKVPTSVYLTLNKQPFWAAIAIGGTYGPRPLWSHYFGFKPSNIELPIHSSTNKFEWYSARTQYISNRKWQIVFWRIIFDNRAWQFAKKLGPYLGPLSFC